MLSVELIILHVNLMQLRRYKGKKMEKVRLTIDGIQVESPAWTTILEAVK